LSKDEELELFENELKKLREGKHNPQRIVHESELLLCRLYPLLR